MSTAVQATSALLGMIVMPAVLSVTAECAHCTCSECSCWRGAYTMLGALLALPVAALASLFLDGAASDHDMPLDGRTRHAADVDLQSSGAGLALVTSEQHAAPRADDTAASCSPVAATVAGSEA